ncbi:hypothetical protein [Streptomyces sp. NPDC056244]|uniref:hypothetical protein n=1 Tax=Streptomyces sp. NPDC056244 TaxID=3345762 RepID=UPI0035DFE2AF
MAFRAGGGADSSSSRITHQSLPARNSDMKITICSWNTSEDWDLFHLIEEASGRLVAGDRSLLNSIFDPLSATFTPP